MSFQLDHAKLLDFLGIPGKYKGKVLFSVNDQSERTRIEELLSPFGTPSYLPGIQKPPYVAIQKGFDGKAVIHYYAIDSSRKSNAREVKKALDNLAFFTVDQLEEKLRDSRGSLTASLLGLI